MGGRIAIEVEEQGNATYVVTKAKNTVDYSLLSHISKEDLRKLCSEPNVDVTIKPMKEAAQGPDMFMR